MKKEEHKNLYKTKNVGMDNVRKSFFTIFFVEPSCQKLWPRLKHKNFYKTKNVDIDGLNKSYFIIFFVEPTYAKLWPRLKFC